MRQLLLDGRIRKANALLGRAFAVEGEVVAGDGRGRTLGFPTANLRQDEGMITPCAGVYAVRVHHAGGVHGGMMNIGTRPTFAGEGISGEVHLFDFEGDLSGQALAVEMIERLRPEQRFTSAEELIAQLQRDRDDALAVVAREG